MPTAGLLAQVRVAKSSDHLPWYRQERIFARAGFAIPRATLVAWMGTCGVHLQPLADALSRLPRQKNNAIDALLTHHWTPVILSKA